MRRREKEIQLYDKDKVIRVVKSLIIHRNSVLIEKYLESYDKLVILYRGNQVEMHKDTRSITYLDLIVPLSKKEYKEMYRLFMDEMKKRKVAKTIEKFHKLELSLDDDTECQPASETVQLQDNEIEQTLNAEIKLSLSS
jgi:hypothetical protein